MVLLVYQKHTQWPGPGRTNDNVVGYPMLPVYAAKAGGFFFIVFGVTALMGGLLTLNPVWRFGPYNPSQVTAGSQPDWYMGVAEGLLRIFPGWETHVLGFTISWNILIPGVIIPGIMFTLMALYPAIESWVEKDKGFHNLLDRPRDKPVRTGLGVMSLTFYMVLVIGGANDILANTFHWSLQATTWVLRVLLIVLPPIAFKVTKRICLGLQHHDEALLHHGVETGIIRRLPSGAYIEVEEPLPPDRAATLAGQIGYHGDAHVPALAGATDGHVEPNGAAATNGEISRPVGVLAQARSRLESFWDEPRETIPDPHAPEAGEHH
jgi:ubiquinol-cytochrome c reductase cytochrome b subunit